MIPPSRVPSPASNAHPSKPVAPAIGGLKPQKGQELFRSRTTNVLSGITSSFSRTSLIPSRRTDNSSSAASSASDVHHITTTNTSRPKAPPVANRLPFSKSGRLSLGSRKSDSHLSRDPCFVHTEQSSAYWTGRFMSLHDKLQSECLTYENLQSLIDAQSGWALARNQQRQPQLLQDMRYTRYSSRLPPSATSAAILQQTTASGDLSTQSLTAQAVDAALLMDDDERCRRVFINLETFCTTEEARKSLLEWQQGFARKTGRKKLLPRGGTMEDRLWDSYLARMGVKRMGKRASIM